MALTGGYGLTDLTLTVSQSAPEFNEVLRGSMRAAFTDKLQVFHLLLLLDKCFFPRAGSYLFCLMSGDTWLAQRSITVRSLEEQP